MTKIQKLDLFAKKLGDWADKLIYILGGAGLLFAVVLCGANILSWWFFGRRLGLTDELSLIGLVWASYVGMGLLYRTNGHCVMDFVIKLLPPKGQTVVRIITDLLILFIAAIAVYYSWKLAIKSFTKKLVLSHIPYFYCDICVTIGYGHLLLLTVADIVRNVYKLFHWNELTEGDEKAS